MFIRTENLLLRPIWPDDLDEFVALLNDERVAKNIGIKQLPDTVEVAREIISRPRERLLPHAFIYLRSEKGLKLIGGIGLGRNENDTELGYWIAPQYWGLGYASEAVDAMLEHCWMLGHDRIVAIHFSDNEATSRVLEKAGFAATEEARMRYSPLRGGEAPASVFVACNPRGGSGMSGEQAVETPPEPA